MELATEMRARCEAHRLGDPLDGVVGIEKLQLRLAEPHEPQDAEGPASGPFCFARQVPSDPSVQRPYVGLDVFPYGNTFCGHAESRHHH